MGNAREVEDFAERLRALKERSGRSYGSLATRLNVSTSTLHRYCNGDAVPEDYAPVERLARLCGATPEELVALHRRWMRADASRHRAREAGRKADGVGGEVADRVVDRKSASSAPRGGGAGDARPVSGGGGADRPADTAPAAKTRSGDGEPRRSATPREDTEGPSNASGTATTPGARPAVDRRQGRTAGSGRGTVTPPSAGGTADAVADDPAETTAALPDGSSSGPAAPGRGDTHGNGTGLQRGNATERPHGSRARPPGGGAQAHGGRARAHGGPVSSASAGRARPPRSTGGAAVSGAVSGAKGGAVSGAGPAPAGLRRLRAVPGSGGGESAVVSRVRPPWALMAGAAAVVVLAVTAVEVRPPGEDGRTGTTASPPATATPSSAPPAGPTARGHLDRHETDGDDASGTPHGGGGTDKRHEERKAGGAASGSPGPDAAKGPGDGGSTRAPLTLSTRSHVWENGCDHRYLIDRPPSEVAPPPTEQDAPTWAAAHGAVHGGTTNVELTVQGRASAAVVLQALHVRVVGRRAPLAWSSFAMENGCGGSLTPRAFSVNLDASRPLARPTDGNDTGKPIPAVRFPYRVSVSDPEVLLVNARTTGCDCSWYLELDWTSGGRSGTLRIDDHGSPFRTSSLKGRPEYGYDYTDGAWHKNG